MTELAPQNNGSDVTPPRWSARSAIRLSILVICVLALFSFAPVLQNDFVNWDDKQNLVRNDAYQGVSFEHLRWMFTTAFAGHYQPLTWLSFALDYQLWGVDPAAFHFTNVVLHVVTAVGLFFVTLRVLQLGFERPAGRAMILGALVAALLFAVHPLRVESVAWATERRDVLSGAWLMLTMMFYLRAAVAEGKAARRAMLTFSLLCYILSLLSKAAGITLPFALLILDVYPLRRLGGRTGAGDRVANRRVFLEKGLFLVPAAVIAMIALWAQTEAGALRSFGEHSIGLRIGQAFYGTVFYLWKTVWPTALAPLYEQRPDATPLDVWNVASAALVVVLSALFWILRKRRPALVTAWSVYIVVLLPVLGLAQAGPQVVADRYTYLSCMPWAVIVGVGIALLWSRSARHGRVAIAFVSLAILVICVTLTRDQTRIWKDSRTLWATVIERGGSMGVAHANLAAVFNERQEYRQACEHSRKALGTLPGNRTAHVALGRCSLELGDFTTAEKHYGIALKIAAAVEKTDAATMAGLAVVKTRLWKFDEAEQLYRDLVTAEPGSPSARYNLAGFLASRGRILEAMEGFEEALRLDPAYTEARFRLGVLLVTLGNPAAAIATLEEGLKHVPGNALLNVKLARILATCRDDRLRNGPRAVKLAGEAIENSDGTDPAAREALAAALAETGDFTGAVRTVEELLSDQRLALPETTTVRLQGQLERYRQGEPLRE